MGSVSDGDSKVETVSLYSQGDYTDLCRGGHVDSTGKVGAFKLTKTAGAYWRGNENNPQMQRIYGVAFATQEELDEYLNRLEVAKQRDHRKLGKELDLYATSPLSGDWFTFVYSSWYDFTRYSGSIFEPAETEVWL